MSANPFTLSFGKTVAIYLPSHGNKPNSGKLLCRDSIQSDLHDHRCPWLWQDCNDDKYCFGITKSEDWIVVELNPTRDLLQSLAAKSTAFPNYTRCLLMQNLTFLLLVWEYPLKTLLRSRISKTLWNSC